MILLTTSPSSDHIEVLIFFYDISSAKNGSDRRCIGTRTSDTKFLQRLYKRCLRKMCRWLCKMLLRLNFFFRSALRSHPMILIKNTLSHFSLILTIDRHKTIKCYFGRGHSETGIFLHRCVTDVVSYTAVCHTACRKTVPDQLIQPEQISAQRILDYGRRTGSYPLDGLLHGHPGFLQCFSLYLRLPPTYSSP